MFIEYVYMSMLYDLIFLSITIQLVVRHILKFLKLKTYCMLNFINVQMSIMNKCTSAI